MGIQVIFSHLCGLMVYFNRLRKRMVINKYGNKTLSLGIMAIYTRKLEIVANLYKLIHIQT